MANPGNGPIRSPCHCSERHQGGGGGADGEDFVSNWGSELCVIEGTQEDYATISDKHYLANKVWAMGKPPGGFSSAVPTVSARRVQVIQAQLQKTTEDILGAVTARSSLAPMSNFSMSSRNMMDVSSSRLTTKYPSRT